MKKSPRLPEDWDSVMEAFLNKYGKDIPEDRLPSQSYFESFEEKLNGNRLKPETLAQVGQPRRGGDTRATQTRT